jgi:hypothetical protein
LLGLSACGLSAGEELAISVLPASAQLTLGQALRLKIAVTNISARDIALPEKPVCVTSAMQLEVRRVGQEGFKEVYVIGQVQAAQTAEKSGFTLPQGETRYDYAVVTGQGDGFPFDAPGIWEMRARLRLGKKPEALSPSVHLLVTPFKGDDQQILTKNRVLFFGFGPQGVSAYATQEAALVDSDMLTANPLRVDAAILQRCIAVRDAKDPRSLADRLNAVNESLKRIDSISREVVCSAVAHELLEARQLDLSQQFANQLPFDALNRIELEAGIEVARSNEKARARTNSQ